MAFGTRDSQHIREVQLTLRIIGVQLAESGTEIVGVESKDTRVHFGDEALLGGGVLLLDDARDVPVHRANDAAVTRGVFLADREHGDRGGHFGVSFVQVG